MARAHAAGRGCGWCGYRPTGRAGFRRSWLLLAQGGGKRIAASAQVTLDRGARRVGIPGLDRLEDGLVLAIHAAQVLHAARRVGAETVDPRARNHRGAEVIEEIEEIAVAGRGGDRAVEFEVLLDAVASRLDRRLHRAVRGLQPPEVLRGAAARRDRRGLGFDPD